MFLCMMLALLVNFFIALHGVAALNPLSGWPGVYQDFQWRAQLCCERPSDGLRLQNDASPSTNIWAQNEPATHTGGLPESIGYHCHVQNSTNGVDPSTESQSFSAKCLDMLCQLDDEQTNLICILKYHRAPGASTSKLTVNLQQVEKEPSTHTDSPDHTTQAQCSGEDTVTCSVAIHATQPTVTLRINGSVNGHSLLSPEMHIITYQLCMPDPPFNLHHNVTTEGEVMFTWNDSQSCRYPLNYEIRYSSNTSLQHWKVLKVQHPWVSLRELSSGVGYTVQVRCQCSQHPQYWSNWSQPIYLTLDVSYIPAEVFIQPSDEVRVYSVFHNHSWTASRAVWMLNGQLIPESQYRVVNERVSVVTIKLKKAGFDTLMCCYSWEEKYKCSIAYSKVYTEGNFEANITCRTDQQSRGDSMTCKWKKSAWAVVRFLYKRYKRMCEEIPPEEGAMIPKQEESMLGVEECPDGVGDFHECTLRDLSLFSCYKLWLVVEGGHGKVRSLPVFVAPIDYVKPSSPSDLEGVTLPNRTLRASWKRPYLPAYDLQYELRYAPLRGMVDLQWKVVGNIFERWAAVPVQDPCVQCKVQVRCRRSIGSGYWSDWSEPHMSSVFTSKAPKIGPDFWRVIREDTSKNHFNVTLLFKTVPAEDPASCVQGLVVVHQASGGALWSDDVALGSFYTFQWIEEVHTITVMSRNSMGSSAKNSNMTLVRLPKRHIVRSFHASANATCVSLSWTLLSDQPSPASFVIEWFELNGDPGQGPGRMEWLRVPSTTKNVQLCRHFYGSEEFRLYPVFVDGEGEPVRCIAARSGPAAYMLLMIIAFLSVVLFVTLIISQNQIKKLMWKDVPNPNNCSWAKGMDFKTLENTDNLFGHSEGLTGCPLLLVSERVCEVEIVDKPCLHALEKDQEMESFLHCSLDEKGKSTNFATIEGSLEPLSLDTSNVNSTPETSGQSSVTYSTVLVFDQPVLLRKQQESLSSSSDEGNFSANNSDISGSFPGGLWELENPSCSDSTNPRNSSSYNSVEEFSETSEQEDEALESRRMAKELYYLGMNEEEEEDFQGDEADLDETVLFVDSSSELERKSSGASDSSSASQTSIPLYLPQFRTAATKLLREVEDSALQL
ncbi:leptin receptor isoform X2 [Salminus brasiliensis]|uniref:leptin receptor isoform X2 n=1 Tax=Salminus brasiliensis TaxID=930266 RepID=UPI003B833224